MASNNIILAVPSANSSVNYELPQSDSAKLSFSPEDIDGLTLDASGGLVISFVEGGQVTLSNFQSFIDNGNTLSLADGTNVDPKLLFNALGGQNDNVAPTDDSIKIDIPAANAQKEIQLEPGQKYLMNFDLSETTGATVKDGKMVIGFENGGKVVITNYETAMAGKTPPELSLASKTCIVTGDELITNIQKLAQTDVAEKILAEEEAEEAAKRKSKIAAAEMEGEDNSGIVDPTALGYKAEEQKPEETTDEAKATDAEAQQVANIQPAAGDEADIARQLAAIETAAGPGGGAGGRAGGYGYGSRFTPDPFATNPDIGPIDPTQLQYRAPILTPSEFLIQDPDSDPNVIGPGAQFVDETNLDNGPLVVSGDIDVDFGADGPGSIEPNGSFSSGGSQTGGQLSANGEPISVTVVGGTYIGVTAGGDKVFELTIDPNTGEYTYTQYIAIDHADGTNPDDQIVLNFGVVVSDSDGDADTTTIQIVVADDAPVIEGSSASVDETDFGTTISATGNLAHDYNQDGPGKIETTGSFTSGGSQANNVLTAGGIPVIVSSTATGYTGTANGVTVFTLTINPVTGDYTYTQFKNLDHADGSNPNDAITLTFGAKITDYDGDSATAPIVITVVDDGPDFQSCGCGPQPDKGLEIVDETNLKNGPAIETGTLDADFGADAPGSYGFKADSFTSSGSKANNALTHNGVPVVVSLVNGEWVGKAGDAVIFKLELNTTTGEYKFTLYDNLDHADKANPDDQIVLDFGVAASDFDGDSMDGSIRIIVKDDGPVANNDVNTYDTTFGVANGNVVTGLNGGPGAADVASTDGWTATDNSNKVVKISFGGNEVDVPETGTVSIDGAYGTLTIAADGTYTYKAFATDGGMIDHGGQKEFTGGAFNVDLNESQPLDGNEQQSLGVAPGNLALNGGETISVTFRSEGASYGNTMGVFTVGADGKLKMETVLIKDGNQAVNGQTYSYTAGADASSLGFFILANGAQQNNYGGMDFSKGALNFVYDFGLPTQRDALATDNGGHIQLVYTAENGTQTVLSGPLYFTTDRGGADNLNADGSVRVVSGIPGADDHVLRIGFEDLPALGDKDYNDIVFDVTITGPSCGCGNPAIQDEFVYTLQDGDGDQDKATLVLNGQDLTDDKPILTAPAIEVVDETTLVNGVITETGAISADFGHDGPGTLGGSGAFTSGGSKLNGALTSGGSAVTVSLEGNTYTGKTAAGVTVFTLTIAANGQYTFKLFEQLDHADGTNPNDEILLNFGITATDCDGDKSETTLIVKVRDDAPDAKDDSNSAGESQTVTGNVKTNDVVGQDTPGTITKVVVGTTTYDLPANGGNVVIVGQYGKLTINNTGAYSYTANSNNPNGVDSFTYTLKDQDGDTDTAVLKITVTAQDDCPVITPSVETVDETNLVSGAITETGTVSANFFSDGPGAITANGAFTSNGSKLGGALTSGGSAVTVALDGNTYTGKTAEGVVVFTLQVAANGQYTFKLFEQLDHADGTDANDSIALVFGVTGTDADGDAASTTITVNVKDDAPDAKDDGSTASEGQTITGHVTSNDIVGQDTPGTITKVVFGTTTYDLPANGANVVINGALGKLTINSTGAYSYTANGNNPDGVDKFTYTLKDKDGDTDTASLSISVSAQDDCPIVVKPADEIVDETNLVNGTITETGTVTANYFGDGPGAITANGSFVSGGSRLGGALTSGGSPVTVALEGNTYTGKTAQGVTVLTLTVAPNGEYTFKLYEQLDHADGNNPNDVITLDFGVIATDADGDTAATTITVKVKDDAPDARDDSNSAGEGQTVTGNVITNDTVDQDVPGKIINVIFIGTTYELPANGANIVINGTFGTLTINNTGAYSYTAHGNNPNGQEAFNYTLQDKDGDTDVACLRIDVSSQDDCPTVTSAIETIDETNLATGVITETGSVTANYFGDGPGAIGGTGAFTSGGSKLGGALTSGGSAITVSLAGDTYTGKTAEGINVFTLQIAANGSYTFKLFEQLDHADGTNPDDIISLQFGVKATDADGDTAIGTITVKVKDDAPDAHCDFTSANEGQTITGNVITNDTVGQDVPGTITKISFGGVSHDLPANGANVVVNGMFGTLTINSTGAYSYTAHSNNPEGTDAFNYTLRDRDGDTDTACLTIVVSSNDDCPIIVKPADEIVDETNLVSGVITETGTVTANYFGDGPGAITANGSFVSGGSKLGGNLTSGGSPVTVALEGNTYTGKTAAGVTVFTLQVAADGSYTFKLFEQLDHADGNNPNDVITLDFGVIATDVDGDTAATTITVQVKDDAPDAKDDGNTVAESGTVTGNVTANDVVGQDVPGKVINVIFMGTTHTLPTNGANLVIDGAFGKLTINNTGAYSYTANGNNPNGTDAFTYTLQDKDGDTDTACLSITVSSQDDVPTITPAIENVDETNLVSGIITETGSVTANYFGDGPGAVSANGAFTSGGSRLNGALTSGGQPVLVTLNGSTYEGKANGVTVFTLSVAADGSYTFKLYEQLDHADGNNPNDVIALNFGVTATDIDGDTATATITVNVKDDAPDAKDDTAAAGEGQTITGNVTANDVVGQDVPGIVTKVVFASTTYTVPATGSVTIPGAFGTLTIDKNGAYSYTANGNNPQGTDHFTYTLQDRDGDTDTASLNIAVSGTDDCPIIVKPADEIVDETNLATGTITETGTVSANYFGDGPGAITATGAFVSGGSKLGGNLTSGGSPVTVSLSGSTYTGKTAEGVTVFTLTVAVNGSYTFKLYEQLDHANGADPNDVITLDFGVVATDADGDTAGTTITVQVKDDAPDARDDGNATSEGQTITGNVTSNDIIGQDVPGKVINVIFMGTTHELPANGANVIIVGQYGKLTINNTGAYSYTANGNNPQGSDAFTYTLRDKDGDTDTACLTITVSSQDDVPTITPAIETVDETALASGTITETGTVTATYGGDGPGTIAATGGFTSGGSKLGGALTSGGSTVTVSLSGNTYTGKTAEGVTVFTLQVASDGQYTFKLYEQLDHANGADPNDVISLNFGVKATDADGDVSNSTITVNVKDDAPDARDDSNSAGEGQTVTGNVITNDTVGQDVPGKIINVIFIGTTYELPANGANVVINGTFGTLTINNTGAYSYTANSNNPNGQEAFNYTLQDKDGDTDVACLRIDVNSQDDVPTITAAVETLDETALASGTITETGTVTATYGSDGPGTIAATGAFTSNGSQLGGALSSGGSAVTVSLAGNTYTGKTAQGVTVFTLQVAADGQYTFKLFEQLDHANGADPNDSIALVFGVKATDADGDVSNSTITVNVKDDAPDAVDDGKTASEGQTITGNVTANDTVGQDVPGLVTKVVFGGTTYTVPATGSVTIPGTYGSLTIDKTGAYSYTAHGNNPQGVDQFVYTLKDNDGDTDTACLSITVSSNDDMPVITPAVETVDETALASGTITETGTVTATYGGDGPGTIAANGAFTSTGSKLGGALTSGGSTVTVSLAGNTYTGKTAEGVTIFTLQVAADASYTFKLYQQLDHANGADPNDVIALNFGVTATDADGDIASSTITVNVKDDAPIANDDHRTMVNGTASITGNVTSNDVPGQDTPATVSKIIFVGQTYDVPANGNLTVTGWFGTLSIDKTGYYTYTAIPGAHGTDAFNYVLTDRDGDSDPACLFVEVRENPLVVCIFADDVYVKEDGHVEVPVNAYFTGSNGNEHMVLTISGVPNGWTITSPGWTKVGSDYTLTLPNGVVNWVNSVGFEPPANSDADLTGLVFKNSVFDPDTGTTTFATEIVDIIVDAVVDPFGFHAYLDSQGDHTFTLTQQDGVQHSKISVINLLHLDPDSSESLKRVSFTIPTEIDEVTFISQKNGDGSYSQVGTKTIVGGNSVYTIDLSGMTYAQAVDYVTNKLHVTYDGPSNLDGIYNINMQIVSYEKNLNGDEWDYSDNETSYTVALPVDFCVSPLVIDLDRDGIELLAKGDGVMFDITNDGIKDKTGWVAKDDALLAMDKNHDGLINDRSELFGNDDNYADGFSNLASYDLNDDGVIDAKDAVYEELRVWQDVNSDGISQDTEMRTLREANITAIQLAATAVSYDIVGNKITHESTVLYGDGTESDIVDAWFSYTSSTAGGVDKGLTVSAPITASNTDQPEMVPCGYDPLSGGKFPLVQRVPGSEDPVPFPAHEPVKAAPGLEDPVPFPAWSAADKLPKPVFDNGPAPIAVAKDGGESADDKLTIAGPTPPTDGDGQVPCGFDPVGIDGKFPKPIVDNEPEPIDGGLPKPIFDNGPEPIWNAGPFSPISGNGPQPMGGDKDDGMVPCGYDPLWGGLDKFLFQTITEGADKLKDFQAGIDDRFDLSNVVSHTDSVSDAINDFVFAKAGDAVTARPDSVTDGPSAHHYPVNDNSNVNVTDLFNNGSLI